MRSLVRRLRCSAMPCRVAVALFALALISLACSCHRNDLGSEFRGAAAKGDLAKVQAMLKVHPDLVFSKNRTGATALHWAATYGHKDVAELLLANRADVNARTGDGVAPLHWAALNGHKDLVELLLANKADVNARDRYDNTPLQSAVLNGHKDVVELLLANKADVNAKGHKRKSLPQWLQELLPTDLTGVGTKTDRGWTPLHSAAFRGDKEVAEVLLDNKADVNEIGRAHV